jgi:AcrR family transcriptional regulator
MKPEKCGVKRRRSILDATLKIWANDPSSATVRRIARECNLTHGAILYHFGTVQKLHQAAADYAVQIGCSRVIAQLIATRNPVITNMDEKTRRQHLIATTYISKR